jgi:hypothetical protein
VSYSKVDALNGSCANTVDRTDSGVITRLRDVDADDDKQHFCATRVVDAASLYALVDEHSARHHSRHVSE